MVGGDQFTLPAKTFTLVLEPENPSVHTIGLGLDDVEVAVSIQIANPDLDRQAEAVGPITAGRSHAGMLGPLQPFAIDILKPHVAANNIVVSVAVEVADTCRANAAVDTTADLMFYPLVTKP